MSQSKPLRPIVLSSGLLSLLAVAACGHIDPPGGASGSQGGSPSTSSGGSTSTAGSTPMGGAVMSCGDAALPPDPITRPGYTEERSPEVAKVLSAMTSQDKIKQLYGIDVTPPYDYRDIERSYDVPSGLGKTIQGYNYRDAGRGVNLVAGQPNNRPSPDGTKDYSTCFPTQSLRAASWDVQLEHDIGKAMGDETMASKNSMLLAPCMNIIRHPFWGRTQETYSEDSYHTGKMASAFTAGLQKHVVGCAKHYAANNIENARQNQNAKMNEQTLREVYSRHFEMVIQEGGIGCLMASYNAVNGVKATQNAHLLTDILRKPQAEGGFGFRGIVLSDWWAMPGDQGPAEADRQPDAVQALKAGLDIELPWSLHYGKLGAALAQNQITTEDLDRAAGRVLEQKFRFGVAYVEDGRWGKGTAATRLEGVSIVGNEPHLELAEETVSRSAVLLKNGAPGAPVLPIKTATSIAVLGKITPLKISSFTDYPPTGNMLNMAVDVNVGDRGSSRVNPDPAKSVGPFEGIKRISGMHAVTNVTMGNAAADGANADFIVVVVGLNAGDEGEEYSIDAKGDRRTLDIPHGQPEFVNEVLALNKPTAIIVQSGSIVNLPWLNHANQNQATIWVGYPGQRGGLAMGKLLWGDKNFSGKMPMAWAKQEDLPPFATSATATDMTYHFGYRFYDVLAAAGSPVQLVFPFGHGLSYTTFEYSKVAVPCAEVTQKAVVYVTADVKNNGSVAGEEVVLAFIKGPPPAAGVKGDRAVKELKGFTKVNLMPGESKTVTIPIAVQDLKHWEGDANGRWIVDPGAYTVMVGGSGADSALTQTATFTVK